MAPGRSIIDRRHPIQAIFLEADQRSPAVGLDGKSGPPVLASAGVTRHRQREALAAGLLGLVLAVTAGAAAEPPAPPRGHLVIIGGGKRPPELMARVAKLAGGPAARVAVIPSASSVPEEVGPEQAADLEARRPLP